MNYQFFGTALIATGIILLIGIVFIVLWIDANYNISLGGERVFGKIAAVCFLSLILFWTIVGVLVGLDALWQWGLVR